MKLTNRYRVVSAFAFFILNAATTARADDLPAAADAPRQPPATTQPATQPAVPRPPQTPVLAANTVVHADVAYGGPDAAMNRLDVYAPAKTSDAPVVLFVHGGEWTRGDKHDVSSKPKFFNENGVVFVSINYRLNPRDKHPAQVDDVATAIAWTHAHAKEFGGDPGKIVIMGHSAGCHLVTLATLNPDPLAKVGMKATDLAGVVAWSGGMYDLVARANGEGMYPPFIKSNFGDDAEKQRLASPMTYAKNAKQCPPFLFASVDDDKSKTSREATNAMVEQINKNQGTARSIVLKNKTHFTANHELGATGDATGPALLEFIKSVTK